MRRLFLKGLLAPVVTLAGDDAHHLLYAMRAKAGDEVVLVDDAGQVARMELTGFTADTVTMRLIERLAADTESPLSLVLAQCLPKGDKLEFIVQKAVELGAVAVQPLASRNSVVRYDAKKAAAKEKRWQKIADEAAKRGVFELFAGVAALVRSAHPDLDAANVITWQRRDIDPARRRQAAFRG